MLFCRGQECLPGFEGINDNVVNYPDQIIPQRFDILPVVITDRDPQILPPGKITMLCKF